MAYPRERWLGNAGKAFASRQLRRLALYIVMPAKAGMTGEGAKRLGHGAEGRNNASRHLNR